MSVDEARAGAGRGPSVPPPTGQSGASAGTERRAARAGARFALREATDPAHRALDERLGMLDLATAAGRARFLAVHARALPPLEAALTAAGFAEACPGWCPRMPALALALGRAATPSPPARIDGAALWGVAYVLEGAKLGGRVLLPRSGVSADDPFAPFLVGPPAPALTWGAFCARLDAALATPEACRAAVAGAQAAFAAFARAVDDTPGAAGA
jgi:heme oxygenase